MKITAKIVDISIYLIISFLILIPFLSGKYLFFLDYFPIMNINQLLNLFYGKTLPMYGGSLIFDLISKMVFFQKILIFAILFLSGYSMYNLIGRMTPSRTARLYAGTLYMLNPYTYIRIIVGHLSILFAYAILPLLIKSFIELLEKKEKKEAIKFILILSLVSFNIHTLGISLIAVTLIFLFWSWKNRDVGIIKIIIFTGILFILSNSYWILPLITANNTMMDNIGEGDLSEFSPKIESSSVLFSVGGMYGFWREGYFYTKDFLPYWQVLFVFIIILAFHGFIAYYRNEKAGIYVNSFIIIAAIGMLFAAGIYGPFPDLYKWLFENTLLKGMRDSHKFVTLLVLSYSFLGALGVADISKRIGVKNKKKYVFMILTITALITPLVYSFTFFNGFAGQIKPTDYPADWYETNNFLNEDKQDSKILFLPWHQYMDFRWVNNTDKRITNPAIHFFDKEVITGINVEIGGIYREVNTPDQIYIDNLLKKRNYIKNFGELISILDIKYVILTRESDYKKYFFLFNQTDLELVKETKTLYVFKNKNDVVKIYQTDDINNTGAQKVELDYENMNPVSYRLVNNTSKKYIVFTEPYSEDWKLDGKAPITAYGVVNAFENNGKEIRFDRFYRINLPGYVISILTFFGLIAVYAGLERKQMI